MKKDKQIHIYLDNCYPSNTIFTFKETEKAIYDRRLIIHTTQTSAISTKLLAPTEGYKLFIHFAYDDSTEIKLGSDNERTDKEIRLEHNLEKLVLSGLFNK